MDILARPAAGRDVSVDDFGDITTVPVSSVEWADGGSLCVTFDGDLTVAQQLAVKLRITSCDADEERLRVAAASFLRNEAPTLEQTVAQVKRLTRIALLLDDA